MENSDDGTDMPDTIVIAGAGHAAGQIVVSLRQGGFDGRLIVIGEEPYPPYQRPPLSKKFLSGDIEMQRLWLRPESFYTEHDIDLRLATRVEHIDREAHRLTLSDGGQLTYDKLVLATGSRVRRCEMPGADLPGVHYLRTIDDTLAIREHFRPGARLVVLGAGYIGLEVAAVAIGCGLHVTVRELADRVMGRVVSPQLSAFYEQVHRDAGVELLLDQPPGTVILGDDRVRKVVDGEGREFPADLVVIGIGVLPVTGLAEAAGLECNDGIVVDEYCVTSDPDILAAGDCTSHPNRLLGKRVRLESVHNAQEQARTVAMSLLGKPQAYAQIPWFWSDQYDLKLQIVGLAQPDNARIVRGDPASRSFAVFCLDGSRLVATEAVNRAREFMLSKKLIAAGAQLDPAAVANDSTDFKALAETALAAAG